MDGIGSLSGRIDGEGEFHFEKVNNVLGSRVSNNTELRDQQGVWN